MGAKSDKRAIFVIVAFLQVRLMLNRAISSPIESIHHKPVEPWWWNDEGMDSEWTGNF